MRDPCIGGDSCTCAACYPPAKQTVADRRVLLQCAAYSSYDTSGKAKITPGVQRPGEVLTYEHKGPPIGYAMPDAGGDDAPQDRTDTSRTR